MRLPVLAKSIVDLFETLMPIFHSLGQRSVNFIYLWVCDEQRWLTARRYDGRVVRVDSQFDVARRRKRH
jgi:hypothetical protein